MTTSLLLTNGYIHSVAEPYANAMHIENGVIAWLGSDDTAQRLISATTSGPVETIDLNGQLITPAFIDGLSLQPLTARDPRGKISALQPSPGAVHYATAFSDDADGRFIAADQLETLPIVLAELKPPTQLLIEVTDDDNLEYVITQLATQPNTSLLRSRHRLLLNHAVAQQHIPTLVEHHVSVTIVPEIVDGDPVVHAPTAALISGGVPVTTGSGAWTGGIWELITALIEHPDADQRISTRAAFNTVTRDGHRVLPSKIAQAQMGAGQIGVGSPAHLNVWHADQLGVQAPDVKAAHWSTDKRAGTALLPILSSQEAAPVLQHIIRDGQIL